MHIQRIRSKLSSISGVLFTIRKKITTTIAKLIYNSLALPYIHYGNTVWSSAAPSLLQSIHSAQKRLIRLILKKKRYEHSNPLYIQLKLLKLQDICTMNACLFIFKSINNFIFCPITIEARPPGPYNLRNIAPLEIPFSRSTQTKRFIRIRGPQLWNALPESIRCSRTVYTFKKKIKHYFVESYSAVQN